MLFLEKEYAVSLFFFFIESYIQSELLSKYCFSGTQQREFNPRFQQTHRSSFVPPYHNQMRGFLWRNPQPQGTKRVHVSVFRFIPIHKITSLCLYAAWFVCMQLPCGYSSQ